MTWTISNAQQSDPGNGTTPISVTFTSAIAANDALVAYFGTTGNNSGAPSLVNGSGNTGFNSSGGSSTTLATQISWAQAIGDCLTLEIAYHGLATQPTVTVADTVGNTYTVTAPAGSFDSTNSNGLCFALATDIRAAAANVNTVTITFSGGTPTNIDTIVSEYTACSGLDGTATATVIAGTTPSTSYTTVNDHVLVLQMCFNNVSYTAATGAFTDRTGSTGLAAGLDMAEQSVATHGTVVNTSINGASGRNCILVLGLNSGGAGTVGTLTDTSGNKWVPVDGPRTSPGGICTTWLYAALNAKAAAASANVLTWTPSGLNTASVFMQACEVNSSTGKPIFDIATGATGNNTAPLTSGTASTSTGLQIGCACESVFDTAPTVGTSGYTQIEQAGGADALMAYLVSSSTSATTSGFATGGGITRAWNAHMLVLRSMPSSPTLVQTTSVDASQFNQSKTVPFLNPVSPGNLLIGYFTMVASNPGAPVFNGFSDSVSDTWSTIITQITGKDAGNNAFIQAIGYSSATNGGIGVQVTASNGDTILSPCQTIIQEWTGFSSAIVVDTSNSANKISGGTSTVPTVNLTIPASSAADLVVSIQGLLHNPATVGTIAGVTATLINNGGGNGSLSEYGTTAGTGTITVNGGTTDTEWAIVAAAFQTIAGSSVVAQIIMRSPMGG